MLCLQVLKEELADIKETEGEMAHVTVLEGILRGTKKPVCVLACYIFENAIPWCFMRG